MLWLLGGCHSPYYDEKQGFKGLYIFSCICIVYKYLSILFAYFLIQNPSKGLIISSVGPILVS